MKRYTRLLTIAGSDSGGGAGIQADLKTFAACGCYGMSAITAVTAQNTLGVTGIHPLPVTTIKAQIRAVLDDIGVDGIKIGMLHSRQVIKGVAAVLRKYDRPPVILDPVMVATSGDRLIEEEAVQALAEHLFPLVDLITPNIPEAELLLGHAIGVEAALVSAARELSDKYGVSVLLKGGHHSGAWLEDILIMRAPAAEHSYGHHRLDTRNTHGTGCTLSSAIAAFCGKGYTLPEAVLRAEGYLHEALQAGARYRLGGGQGPVHHFHAQW